MSFSKENMEKMLDDLLLKMAELSERDDLTVEQHCNVAEVIVRIAEIRRDGEHRREMNATTNQLLRRLGIKH